MVSWEQKELRKVCCFTLSVETVSTAWAMGLRTLHPHTMPVVPLSGMPFDMARNQAVFSALEQGFDYIFFLDSDVIPQPDAVLRLLAHNKPFISGVYHRRSPPESVPVCIKNGTWFCAPPGSGVHEVDMVGAGLLLIHRSVFEKIPLQRPEMGKPWFDWKVDAKTAWRHDCPRALPEGECLSEDFSFCINMKRTLGIPVLVDFSIQSRHVGYGESTFMKFAPCNTQPAIEMLM